MWGSDDPNNRKPMVWDDLEPNADHEIRSMPDVLEWYTRMIGLRRDHEALRVGSFKTVVTDDRKDVWMYRRVDDNDDILVAINAGDDDTSIELPEGAWVSIYSE